MHEVSIMTLEKLNELSKSARRVYLGIAKQYNGNTPAMSDTALADSLGIAQPDCSRGLNELKKNNLIEGIGYKSYTLVDIGR